MTSELLVPLSVRFSRRLWIAQLSRVTLSLEYDRESIKNYSQSVGWNLFHYSVYLARCQSVFFYFIMYMFDLDTAVNGIMQLQRKLSNSRSVK